MGYHQDTHLGARGALSTLRVVCCREKAAQSKEVVVILNKSKFKFMYSTHTEAKASYLVVLRRATNGRRGSAMSDV